MTAKVYAVANNKGGVAKTTTSGNLAYGLSRKLIVDGEIRGGVLLIDLDPQGNAADFFGVRDEVYDPDRNPTGPCVSKLLTGQATWKQSMLRLSREELPRPNLFLIPASRALEYVAEQLVVNEFVNSRPGYRNPSHVSINQVLSARLASAMELFTYIIIDCPPKLDTLKIAVYTFADHVIVPVKTDYISVAGAAQHTREIVRLQKEEGVKVDIAYVLPTFMDKRQVMARQMHEALVKAYGRQRVSTPIPESVKVKEAPGLGRSLFEYAPDSEPAEAYRELVEKIYAR